MTILNAHLSPSRAVLLTDTLTCDIDGTPGGAVSKLAVIPHLRAVTAVRGSVWLSTSWRYFVEHVQTVGALRALAPEATKGLLERYKKHAPEGYACDGVTRTCEFITFAWDDRKGRVIGWMNDFRNGFVTEDLPDGTHAVPWIPGYPTAARVPLVDVTLEQIAVAKAHGVPAPVGGDGVRATVTRRGVSVSVLPKLFQGLYRAEAA